MCNEHLPCVLKDRVSEVYFLASSEQNVPYRPFFLSFSQIFLQKRREGSVPSLAPGYGRPGVPLSIVYGIFPC